MQAMTLVRQNDATAAPVGRESLTWARSSGSRKSLVEALACRATVAKAFPSKMFREEQQATTTDPARRARLAAETSDSRWKAEEAKTEGLRNASGTSWSDRRPRVLPPPDVWAEGQIDLGALPRLPPPDQWSESDAEAASDALSNLYYRAALKICDDAATAASRREGAPVDDDAHVPDDYARYILEGASTPTTSARDVANA
jgi:hypothetical protein